MRWLCATLITLATVLSGAVSAAADPTPTGKKLVVLGDSYSANAWDFTDPDNSCLRHGRTAWPAQLARLMSVDETDDVVDPSCPGASIDSGPGWTLAQETAKADKSGAFGPRTKLVTLQFGLNDHWGGSSQTLWKSLRGCVFDLIDGCDADAVGQGRITDYRGVSGAVMAERLRNAVTYIRYYAPNAHIVLVGYPELFTPGTDVLCLSFLGVAPLIQPRGRAVVDYLDRIDQAQQQSARLLGLDYLDTRALTAGHGLCSPQPWVNGVFDPRTDVTGLFFHPSSRGDTVVANALDDRYGR